MTQNETIRLRPDQFLPGDVVNDGATIVAYDRIGRGGAIYRVRAIDGTEHYFAFDRRRSYEVVR